MDMLNVDPTTFESMDDDLLRDLLSAVPLYRPGRTSTESAEGLLEALPQIDEKRLKELGQSDGSCSICLQPFLSLLAEQETAEAMDSPAHANHELGVSQLDKGYQCGHLFCRKDLVKWIKEMKDTCPMCRKGLFDPNAKETEPPLLIFGATPRLTEFYRNMGVEVESAQATQDRSSSRGAVTMGMFS